MSVPLYQILELTTMIAIFKLVLALLPFAKKELNRLERCRFNQLSFVVILDG